MISKPSLIVIVGPTAVGKTKIAIELAEALNGEIVSADSRLFYRGMDIGTAKPSREDRARIRHHLIDVANPDQTWSLAVFQKAADDAIKDIIRRGKLPFLVGGTGQYVHAVTKSWTPPPVEPNDKLRLVLEKLAKDNGIEWLHARLSLLDAQAGKTIDARNIRRVVRALEVILTTGKRFSDQKNRTSSDYSLIQIGLILPRTELYKRIDERIDSMFSNGLLDEIKEIMDLGYSPDLPTMSAIGYRECIKVLNGSLTEEQAKSEMRKSTRVFVRRQSNWFKSDDPDIAWFEASADPSPAIEIHISAALKANKKSIETD